MDKNKSLLIAAIIFGIIGFLHLLRSLFGWQWVLADFKIPLYLSYIAVIVLVICLGVCIKIAKQINNRILSLNIE